MTEGRDDPDDPSKARLGAERYILETNYGIIPFELWDHQKDHGVDPFASYSEAESYALKRRFRKIKGKAKVKRRGAKSARRSIDQFLRKKEEQL